MPRYRFVAELWVDADTQDDASATVGDVLSSDRLVNAGFECQGTTNESMHWEQEGD